MQKSKQKIRTNKISPHGKFERHFLYVSRFIYGDKWAVGWGDAKHIRRTPNTIRKWITEGIPLGEVGTVNQAIQDALEDKIAEAERLLEEHRGRQR